MTHLYEFNTINTGNIADTFYLRASWFLQGFVVYVIFLLFGLAGRQLVIEGATSSIGTILHGIYVFCSESTDSRLAKEGRKEVTQEADQKPFT